MEVDGCYNHQGYLGKWLQSGAIPPGCTYAIYEHGLQIKNNSLSGGWDHTMSVNDIKDILERHGNGEISTLFNKVVSIMRHASIVEMLVLD